MRCEAGVYKITNLVTGESYVGSSKNIRCRVWKHRTSKKETKFGRAVRKYGWENFEVKTLERVDLLQLSKVEARFRLVSREQYWIDTVKGQGGCQYNLCPYASSSLGVKQSGETVMKHKSVVVSEETRAKLRLAHLRRKLSGEDKEIMARRVEKLKGRKRPEWVRKKISESRRLKPFINSPETRVKISRGLIGKKASVETRLKMSLSQKARWDRLKGRKDEID